MAHVYINPRDQSSPNWGLPKGFEWDIREEQPDLNWGTHSTKPTNPAEVEAMTLDKFDAEE